MAKLKKVGFVGAFVAGLLCFLPWLAVILGVSGLGITARYADYLLIPILLISVGLIGFSVYKTRKEKS